MNIPLHIADAARVAMWKWSLLPTQDRGPIRDVILETVYPLVHADTLRYAAAVLERSAATGPTGNTQLTEEARTHISNFARGVGLGFRARAAYIEQGGTPNGTPDRASRRARIRQVLRNWNGRRPR